jgi:hypothetical protein
MKTKGIVAIALMLIVTLLASMAFVSATVPVDNHKKMIPTEFKEETVKVKKPSMEELLDVNKEYFNFLRKNLGEKGEEMVNQAINNWAEYLEKAPDEIEVKLKLVKVGEKCITFWPYQDVQFALDNPLTVEEDDPINLIFYNTGSAWDVQYDMKNWIDNTWADASGWSARTYIDDTANGGTAYWKWQDYQLENGDYWGYRYHIRIFGSEYPDPHWADEWSDANVHYERWTGTGHEIISYEQAENFVKNDFSDEWFVGNIWYANLGNDNLRDNDGLAPVIELTA